MCPSVCQSQVEVLSKWLNSGWSKQNHTIAQASSYLSSKTMHGETLMESLQTDAPNARRGRKQLRLLTNNSLFSKTVQDTHILVGQPFVKRFDICYRTAICLSVCLSVLSVTLVYCGQTVGRIKLKLGMHVCLGPGHTVLDGDPAPPKWAQPPNSRPMSVVAKRLNLSICHVVRR